MGFLLPIAAAIGPMLSSVGAGIGSMFAGGAAAGTAAAGAAASSSMALGAASTGIGVIGSIFNGINAYQQNMFQSNIARYNSQLATQNKFAALQAGQNQEEAQRIKTGKLVGQTAAAEAAGGIDVAGGSAQALRTGEKLTGEMDALNIRYNAARTAYGYGQEAFSDTLQSKEYKQAAVGGLIGGIFGAGSNFLSGASSLADKWSQFQMSGALAVPGGGSSSSYDAEATPVPF